MFKIKYASLGIAFLLFNLFFISVTKATVTDVGGYISNNEDVTVYGDGFGSVSSVFYIGDNPIWTDCTKKIQQNYTGNMSWNGPNTITLNLNGFNAGEKVYLFHANTDIDSGWTVGFPLVVERPHIVRHKYKMQDNYSITVEGSGFSQNINEATVYICNAANWNMCTIKEEQNINTWQDYYINFNVNIGSLNSGEVAYIYVVDKNGQASDGYKINLGRPTISSLQESDGILKINGTNFFTDGELIKYDDGEAATPGESIGTNGWVTKTSVPPVYSSSETRTGSNMSIFSDMYETDSNFFLINTDPGWKKIYVSFWFNGHHDPASAESRNVKPFGLRGYDENTFLSYPQARFDLYPNMNSTNMYISDVDGLAKQATKREVYNMKDDELFLGGGWHRREFYVDLGDIVESNGEYTYWRDALIAGHIKGCFRSKAGLYQIMGINMFYAKDVGDPAPRAYFYFDDIYVSTTQARVEIGDKQNWNECTKREIQIPISWTKNEIEVNLDKGAFSQEDSMYLFIVDASGNVSEGYPLTIGTQSDTTPPTLSSPLPIGTQPTGTTTATLSITTNENSTCKYSTTSGTPYSSIPNTFTTTGGTTHTQTITGLTNGNTYNYYIRCSDTSGNVNTNDTTITFSINNQTYNLSNFTSLITNWLGIGDNNSDLNNDGVVNTRDLGIMMSGWE